MYRGSLISWPKRGSFYDGCARGDPVGRRRGYRYCYRVDEPDFIQRYCSGVSGKLCFPVTISLHDDVKTQSFPQVGDEKRICVSHRVIKV